MQKMTMFFSKNTGFIEAIFSDVISYEDAFYGRHKDMESYCIRVVIDYNNELISNMHLYKVDLLTKQITLKEEMVLKCNKLEF